MMVILTGENPLRYGDCARAPEICIVISIEPLFCANQKSGSQPLGFELLVADNLSSVSAWRVPKPGDRTKGTFAPVFRAA